MIPTLQEIARSDPASKKTLITAASGFLDPRIGSQSHCRNSAKGTARRPLT